MNSKIILLSLLIAAFTLAGCADAAQITYDTSNIPDEPVMGETYIVPVTISGDDVLGFTFTVNYDKNATNVSFKTDGGAVVGGSPGKLKLIGSNGATSFNLSVKPLSKGTVTLNFSEIYDYSFELITVANSSCVLFDDPVVPPTTEPPVGKKIHWNISNVEFDDNGCASIPVYITGADRVQGITVKLSNVSGGKVALNKTYIENCSAVRYDSMSNANKLLYSTTDIGYTNEGTAQLFIVDISNASDSYVNFTLTYEIVSSGKNATSSYITNPVIASIPTGIEPLTPTPTPTTPSEFGDFLIDVPESVPYGDEVQIEVRSNGSKNWTSFLMELSNNTLININGSVLGNGIETSNETHVIMYEGNASIENNSLLFTIVIPPTENMSETVTLTINEIYRKFMPIYPLVNPITFTINYSRPIVRYDTGEGATKIDDQFIEDGAYIVTDKIPVKRGYAFIGWRCGGETVYADEIYYSDTSVTLTAAWGKVPNTADTDQLRCLSTVSKYLMKKTTSIDMAYDIDKDGKVKLIDFIYLLQYVADNEEI